MLLDEPGEIRKFNCLLLYLFLAGEITYFSLVVRVKSDVSLVHPDDAHWLTTLEKRIIHVQQRVIKAVRNNGGGPAYHSLTRETGT